MIDVPYRGQTITYNESESRFEVENEELGVLFNVSLSILKKKIDAKLDEPDSVKRQPKQDALVLEKSFGYHYSRITEKVVGTFGLIKRSFGSQPKLHVWVSNKGKYPKRERLDATYSRLYRDTPENREIMEKIIARDTALYEHRRAEEKAVSELVKCLEMLEPVVEESELPVWSQ